MVRLGRLLRERSIAQILVGIFAAAIGALGVTLLLVSQVLFQSLVADLAAKEARMAAETIFQSLYGSMRAGWDPGEIQGIVDHANEHLTGARIDLVRAAPVVALFGERESNAEPQRRDPDIARALASGRDQVSNTGRIITIVHPFVSRQECLRCHTNVGIGQVNGAARITIPLAPLSEPLRETLAQVLVAFVAVALLILFAAFLVAKRWLVQPLMRLSQHMSELRHGEPLKDRSDRVARSRDFLELHQLARSFDDLMDDLSGAHAQLSAQSEQLRFVLDGSELGFWDWNIRTGEVQRNERWATMLGYSPSDMALTVKQWTDFIHPDDRERVWQSIQATLDGQASAHRMEYRMLHKDGGARWILDQGRVMERNTQGNPTRMCGTHSDITERKRLEQTLERQAHFDFLTQVCNRGYFVERAQREIAMAKRYGGAISLLMMDLDHFKRINDRFGHLVGDKVLQRFAELCLETVREIDIVGRLGGEEFAIMLPNTAQADAVEAAERLRSRLARSPARISDILHVPFTVSIGVATMVGKDCGSMDAWLNAADQALYRAKSTGRNRVEAAPLTTVD